MQMAMIPALLVSLLCAFDPGAPVQVTAIKHEAPSIISNDAQCNLCPCWYPGPPPYPGPGCSIVTACSGPCGYIDIANECPGCIQWGPFGMSDVDGCVDMDLLPVPEDDWAYWVAMP